MGKSEFCCLSFIRRDKKDQKKKKRDQKFIHSFIQYMFHIHIMNTFQISSPLTVLSWLDLTWNCIPPVKKKEIKNQRLILSSAANNSPKLLMLLRWWSTTHNSLHSGWRVTNHQQCRTPEWEQEELWIFSEHKDTDVPSDPQDLR